MDGEARDGERRDPASRAQIAYLGVRSTRMAHGTTAWGRRADTEPRRRDSLEVLVFLLLIGPSMLLSFLVVRQGGLTFVVTAWATIVFFLWRNGEPVDRIGWRLENGGREALLGLGLFVMLFAGSIALESLLRSAGTSAPATPRPQFLTAKGPAELALALTLVAVVAVAEETIFRGYLILRFSAITRRPRCRRVAVGDCLRPRSRLRGHDRRRHHWSHGVRSRGRLPLAADPGGARRDAFPPGFHGRHRPAAGRLRVILADAPPCRADSGRSDENSAATESAQVPVLVDHRVVAT